MQDTEKPIAFSGQNSKIKSCGFNETEKEIIVRNNPCGIAFLDEKGRFSKINQGFTDMFGYSHDEISAYGLTDLFQRNQEEIHEKLINVSAPDTELVELNQVVCRHKDGSAFYVMIHGYILAKDDVQLGSCCYFTNISNQVRAELHAQVQYEISHAINSTRNLNELYQAIHQSLSKLLDTTNFFIALYDKEKDQIKFVYYTDVGEFNSSEIEIIEHASEVKGSYTVQVISTEKPLLLFEDEIKQNYESNHAPIGPISRNWLGVPLSVKNKVIGAVALQSYSNPKLYSEKDIDILQSVTEQIAIAIETKSTEETLKESVNMHKSLFEEGVDAMMVHDLGGQYLKVNDVAVKRFGYTRKELLAMSPLSLTLDCDEAFMEKRVSELLENGQLTSEVSMTTKSGRKIPTELNCKIIDFNGKKAILSSNRDISVRKKAEEEHKILEQRLSRAQTMQALGHLAGSVAHDLNNILSGITSYPELLLRKLSHDDPLRAPLKVIMKSGFRAAEIVEDMLTLTRLGKKRNDVISINRSISEFLSSPEYNHIQNSYPDIEVKTSYDPHLLNVEGSDVHLSKIYLNLLKNSFEAISGRGRINIVTENRYISSQVINYDFIKEGEYVTLEISDTGVGIPKTDIENIFEPFYTTKTMGKSGTGLGMAIIWRTVKDHNGNILLDSTEGQGTKFTLFFPASRKELLDKPVDIRLDDYLGNQELIYLVDDVRDQRVIASSILKELGYHVRTFESGEAVLEYLDQECVFPDLFILDMIMDPGMDGAETFRKICKLNDASKAIIASGFSETNQVKDIIDMGVGKFLKKPYTLDNLAICVKNELNKK